MNKKIFLFISSIFGIYILIKTFYFFQRQILYEKQSKLILKNISPENTIFAFDLHDVIAEPKVRQMITIFFNKFPWRYSCYLINPAFWYEFYKLAIEKRLWSQVYNDLLKKYPELNTLKPLFNELMNSQELNLKMIEMIRKLKSCGYKVFLLSNIWETLYDDFKVRFPEIKNIFDGYFIPDKTLNHVKKPEIDFYYDFLNYLSKLGYSNQKIIFIDERLDNIKAANKVGIVGILFNSYDQLRILLKKWLINCNL